MRLLLLSISILFSAVFIYRSDLASQLALPLQRSFLRSSIPKTPTQPFPSAAVAASLATKAGNMTVARKVKQHFLAIEQAEGAGARVRRSIGTPKLRNFSPFLMLDHFTIHPGAGFPDHPHRGQETITYLLKGAVDHEDFAGNAGTIGAGDLQFMTAGRGIMHAEMPNQSFVSIAIKVDKSSSNANDFDLLRMISSECSSGSTCPLS